MKMVCPSCEEEVIDEKDCIICDGGGCDVCEGTGQEFQDNEIVYECFSCNIDGVKIMFAVMEKGDEL